MSRSTRRSFLRLGGLFAAGSALALLPALPAAAHPHGRHEHRGRRRERREDRDEHRERRRDRRRREHRRYEGRHYGRGYGHGYDRYPDSYYCKPCGHRFHSRRKFHDHLHHHHHIPLWKLPFVIIHTTLGWIFHG